MNIKGFYTKPKPPTPPTLTGGIESILQTVNDLNATKKNVVDTLDKKIKEVDKSVEKYDSKIKEVDTTIQNAEDTLGETIKQVIDYTRTIIKGEPGKDADEVDQEKLVKDILEKLPKPEKFDEKGFINKVIKAIPQNKASLKVIRETFETDPMSIIDKIMALPDTKFKLKSSQIDGLDQTIRAFQSQLARGYLHGGGDTVVAGTNVTITKNTNGTKTINSIAGVWLNDNLTTNARLTVSATAPANPAVFDLWYDIS